MGMMLILRRFCRESNLVEASCELALAFWDKGLKLA